MESYNYYCKLCNYKTNTKCNYERHNKSEKHKLRSYDINSDINSDTREKLNESDNDDIKKLMEMINKQNEMINKQNEMIKKQNEIIEDQNSKLEVLETKVELLMKDKTVNKHTNPIEE